MSRVVVFTSPRSIAIEESADPPLQGKEVRLRTLYSGISAGTELTAYRRGSNPYLHKRWDADRPSLRMVVDALRPACGKTRRAQALASRITVATRHCTSVLARRRSRLSSSRTSSSASSWASRAA